MKNKICLITGASSGIGKITAIELAKMGANVSIICRSQVQAEYVCTDIRKLSKSKAVDYFVADLGCLESVKQLIENVKNRLDRIDVLINNAGLFYKERHETHDKIESHWQVNYLSHFFLTNSLIDILKKSESARIINVSSEGHRWSDIDFKDLVIKKKYNGLKAYGRSKLAQIYFTYELAEILKGSNVTVNALHPGFVSTNIGRDNGIILKLIKIFGIFFSITPEKGAETSIYLASSNRVENVTGKYFFKNMPIRSSMISYNREIGKHLWKISWRQLEDKGFLNINNISS